MSYLSAVDHLYALGHELAPTLSPTGTPAPRRKFDLAHMRALMAALGDPQTTFPSVLIAGTNGKGSTASTLAAILTAAGYRTALYTSPHLMRVNERIQIDGVQISDEDFARLYFQVDDAANRLVFEGVLPHHPSFFEVLTALAFLYFAEQKTSGCPTSGSSDVGFGTSNHARVPHPSQSHREGWDAGCPTSESSDEGCESSNNPDPSLAPKAPSALRGAVDIAILEVGLGGRLDATNIVDPLVSIITDIALDHQDYLGDTIAAITREKAGILRPNGILVTLPQHPEANQAIGEAAATLNLTAISAAPYIPPTRAAAPAQTPGAPRLDSETWVYEAPQTLAPNHYTLTLDNQTLEVNSPLHGQHQQRNIALAIAAAIALRNHASYKSKPTSNQSSYKITNANIEAGIRNTSWPGRLELISAPSPGHPPLLLDVAHNPAGAWTLRAAIAELPSAQPRTLIFSCLRDKSLKEMSQILLPLFDSTSGDPDRARDHIILAPIDNPRAASLTDLLAAAHAMDIPAHAAPHIAAALAEARAKTPPDGIIIATGSIYLVGEIRHLALHAEASPA